MTTTAQRRRGSATAHPLYRGLTFVAMCVLFVIPHSSQFLSAALLVVIALASAFVLVQHREERGSGMLPFFAISAVANLFYIGVGQSRGAPVQAAQEVFIVAVVAPMMWLTILSGMRLSYSERSTCRLIEAIAFLSSLSVALFFFLYFTFGPHSVQFFIRIPNVVVEMGTVSATMLVYGTLIFVLPAILSSPDILYRGPRRWIVPFALVMVALTSGRTALLLAGVIGIVVGILLRGFVGSGEGSARKPSGNGMLVRALPLLLGVFVILIAADALLAEVDLATTFGDMAEKIHSGGGEERTNQFRALLDGISDTYGLGAGHGIGVAFNRAYDKPWRYELYPLASLFRMGLLGFILGGLPFFKYLSAFVSAASHRSLSQFDVFLFAGWVSLLLASFTNPYPESFIFQGLLFLPVVLFPYERIAVRRAAGPARPTSGHPRWRNAQHGRGAAKLSASLGACATEEVSDVRFQTRHA
jgi:hypothetical protein